MLVKYWKNFKWFLFIPLICFIMLFKIYNVKALVYKTDRYDALTNNTQSGVVGPNQTSTLLTTTINNNGIPYSFFQNYDYIGFKIQNLKLGWTESIGSNSSTCTQVINNSVCGNWVTTGSVHYTGTFSFNARLRYDSNDNYLSLCYFDSTIEDMLICPIIYKNRNITDIQITISNGNINSNLNYSYVINVLKSFFNNDSTEIAIQQNTTNTNLQYIYQQQQDNQQYLENDSTSGASTQATGDFTELAQDFNEQLSGVNDLTQLVLLPISLFMDLATDNCQPLHLQIPYVNMSVDLPCMKAVFNQYFNGFYSIFTTIMSAVICYWVAVKTGSLIKDILDCDNDRIEVVDL